MENRTTLIVQDIVNDKPFCVFYPDEFQKALDMSIQLCFKNEIRVWQGDKILARIVLEDQSNKC